MIIRLGKNSKQDRKLRSLKSPTSQSIHYPITSSFCRSLSCHNTKMPANNTFTSSMANTSISFHPLGQWSNDCLMMPTMNKQFKFNISWLLSEVTKSEKCFRIVWSWLQWCWRIVWILSKVSGKWRLKRVGWVNNYHSDP